MFLLKKFAFWFSAISVLICLNNHWGNDEANILLIGLNPILNAAAYTEPFRHWVFDFESAKYATDSSIINVRFPAYAMHFCSSFLAGLAIDFVICFGKRKGSAKHAPK